MKGLSEIAVIVMITVISISLVSGAFLWYSVTSKEVYKGVEEMQAPQFVRACLKIIDYNFTELYISIVNCGTAELKNFIIYADNIIVADDNVTRVRQGETKKLFFTDVPYEGIRTIKVTANYGEAYDAEQIPKVLLIKNVNVNVG